MWNVEHLDIQGIEALLMAQKNSLMVFVMVYVINFEIIFDIYIRVNYILQSFQ